MFRFIKCVFILAMMLFGCNLPSVNSLKSISINNQEYRVRPYMSRTNETRHTECKCVSVNVD